MPEARRAGAAPTAAGPPAPEPAGRVVAASDCERCRDGWLTQPLNAASSLAYVVAGAALVRAARRRRGPRRRWAELEGWAVVGVGLGSAAYHGPAGAAARRAHDASLVALGAVVALSDLAARAGSGREARLGLAAVPALAVLAAAPSTSAAAQATAGLAAVAAEVAVPRRDRPAWATRAAVPLWATAVAVQVLGRTGGPLCRPGSALQPHAAWHLLSAAGLWLRGQVVR